MWWTRERRRVIDVARRVEPRERCEGVQDERRFERTAKPCGPDAPTLAFKSRASVREAMVTTKPGHQGEHGISRKAITQGMPDASAEPVCSCAHPLSPLRTRPRVQRASGIPCALVAEGEPWQDSGVSRRENAKLCPLESTMTKISSKGRS